MNRQTLAGVSVLGGLAVVLVLGTQLLKGDPNGETVVTVLGLLSLGISQLLGNREAQQTREKTEELSEDLRNGTFERLLREALVKLASEKDFPLEIKNSGEEGKNDG